MLNHSEFILIAIFFYTLVLINNKIVLYTYSSKWKEWFIFTCKHWRVQFLTTLKSEMEPYPSNLIPVFYGTNLCMDVVWQNAWKKSGYMECNDVIADFTTLGESHIVWPSPIPLQTHYSLWTIYCLLMYHWPSLKTLEKWYTRPFPR